METSNTNPVNNVSLAFAATDKSYTEGIPKLTEKENGTNHFVSYGDDNRYPMFLHDLYENVGTLRTIIDGTANYVAGDDVSSTYVTIVNKKGHTLRQIVEWAAKDYLIYGGFALQVIRSKGGQISEIYYLDFRDVRSDKEGEVLYYSKEFGKKYGRSNKMLVYPHFVPNGSAPSSILYVKNTISTTYPVPRYSGAIKACMIEELIDDLHLNSLENGLMPSYLISFLNGVPTDEQKAEIEREVDEKFCGASNAGRVILNFANGKDNAAQVDKLDITDFSEKYQAAATRSREQIFCAFQAVPALFGLMTESKGFAEEEFQQAFKLYNRTVVRGIQRTICDAFDYIYGNKNVLTIRPFSIDDEDKELNVN